jgi:gliding motility-associated-like protein
MKHVYALLVGILLAAPVYATHIVGGELSLQAVKNNPGVTHQLTLSLYFDAIRGNRGAIDPSVTVNVYRKRDLVLMGQATLPLISDVEISYNYPVCVKTSGLQTELITYAQPVNFPADVFDDSEGYILAWERCCRNNVITNLSNPAGAGMVFYLEMPPVSFKNAPFIDSSPNFTTIRGDYICKDTPFSFDFSATDADGDSLSYRLVTPYNGFSTSSNPSLSGRPSTRYPNYYPEVTWQVGFSASNAIPGKSPLAINPLTGQLTVTASTLGLFVFSVEVTEYRKGQRIGLVRRDFQLQVIDCQPNAAPLVQLREAGKPDFYTENQVIRIARGQSKCLTFFITDPNVGQQETITVKPVKGRLGFTLTPDHTTILSASDTIRATLCLDQCTASADGEPLVFDVISSDNGCPNARSDTLRVALFIEPALNQKPVVSTSLPGNQGVGVVGQPFSFTVTGVDPDNDSLRLDASGVGFALASAGMEFSPVIGKGKVNQVLKWTPKCGTGPYVILFRVQDLRCANGARDSLRVSLTVPATTNQRPGVSTTLVGNSLEVTVDLQNPPPVRFDVLGTDADNNTLVLTGTGRGFDLKSVGMQFTNQSGKPTLRSPFSWTPSCRMLAGAASRTFVIDFLVDDQACLNRYDTVTVKLTLVDRPTNYEVTPTNVFTPNGDGKNDFFSLDNLPGDNCTERFERIVIYNRWGKEVFQDASREFRWYGTNYPSGEYYYLIEYTRRKYKGPLTLLR